MVLSVSHIDLDGIGSQIVLRTYLGDITRMNINYNKIDEYLDIIDDFCTNRHPEYVYITDLSFTFEQLTKLSNITMNHKESNFIFIDHHPFEEDYKHLIKDNFKIIISHKASATKLTYLYMNKYNPLINTELETFVSYVNAYDIWLQDHKEFKPGLVLNDLFWEYKIDYFWTRFKDTYRLNNKDKENYKDLYNRKNKLFKKLEDSNRIMKFGDNKILLIFIDEFRSHITLDYPDFLSYVIITSYGSCSVRLDHSLESNGSIKDLILDSLDHSKIDNSGGHNTAFGIKLKDSDPHNLVQFAKEIVQSIDKVLDNN